jgi:iron(III) transport system substrate-binding protein
MIGRVRVIRILPLLAVLAAFAVPAVAQPVTGQLTLYTSQPDRDAARTVAAFRKVQPGVQVQIFRSGTTEVMNKLQAEFTAGAPRADVLLIADAVSMERLKADHRLKPEPGLDLSHIPAGAYDQDQTYFGSKLITTGIVYNIAASMQPTSWADLLKPAAKGQVVLPSPLYSGAAAIHMAALQSALGPNYYKALAANGAVAMKGNGSIITAVASGQAMYGFVVDFMALNAEAKGSPVRFVFPKEGVSAVTEPVAVLAGTRNPAAARAFVAFILSKAGQDLAVSQGYLPVRDDVAPPHGFPKLASVHLLPLDVPAAIAADAANKKAFAALFGG